MKKIIVLFLVLTVAFSASAFSIERIGSAVDFGAVQDLILNSYCVQTGFDFRAQITNAFEARIPISATLKKSAKVFDFGLEAVYYSFDCGFFMGMTVLQFAAISGDTSIDSSFMGLSQVEIGYTYIFKNGILLEGSLAVNDPSGSFSEEYSSLKGNFPSYRTLRPRLKVGYSWEVKNEN